MSNQDAVPNAIPLADPVMLEMMFWLAPVVALFVAEGAFVTPVPVEAAAFAGAVPVPRII